MAPRRPRHVGQPLIVAQSQWRLRHEPTALPLSHHAEGRRAGLRTRFMAPEAEPSLTLTDAPGERVQAVIREGLGNYNVERAGYRDARPLAIVASDPEAGEVIGGLLGRT